MRYQSMVPLATDLRGLDQIDVAAITAEAPDEISRNPSPRRAPAWTALAVTLAGALLVVLGVLVGAQLAGAL